MVARQNLTLLVQVRVLVRQQIKEYDWRLKYLKSMVEYPIYMNKVYSTKYKIHEVYILSLIIIRRLA